LRNLISHIISGMETVGGSNTFKYFGHKY